MSRTVNVPLTAAQINAVCNALETYLLAGTDEECVQVFRSAQGTAAASRAHDTLIRCGNTIGAFGRRRRRGRS